MTTDPLYLLHRLVAIHERLDRAGFDHAVGGGIALATHQRHPRFTDAIDLNVMADPSRPEELLRHLPEEIAWSARDAAELRELGQVRLWWPDPDTPVDLFLPQHPTFHRLVTERAAPVDFGGASINVITATDLIIFKSLFNRAKDWVDIEVLLREGTGDAAEVKHWLAEILGADSAEYRRFDELASTLFGVGEESPRPRFLRPEHGGDRG